jgi:hypothetical protein
MWMMVMPSGPKAVAIVNLGAKRSTAHFRICLGVAVSRAWLSRSNSSKSSSVGHSGGVAANAPLGSSELGARTFNGAADFCLGSGLAESPGGTGAFISGFGRADMAGNLLESVLLLICYKYDLFSQVSIVCWQVLDERF